jgi:hypothetical protein
LTKGQLPFGPCSFSAIICIHYPVQKILADFDNQLMGGGHLFIETFGGHGENYLELPKADEIRQALIGCKLQATLLQREIRRADFPERGRCAYRKSNASILVM